MARLWNDAGTKFQMTGSDAAKVNEVVRKRNRIVTNCSVTNQHFLANKIAHKRPNHYVLSSYALIASIYFIARCFRHFYALETETVKATINWI